MDLIELENKRISLIQKLDSWTSNSIRLSSLYNYFEVVLATQNKLIIEAFAVEFLEIYSTSIEKAGLLNINPRIYQQIIDQVSRLKDYVINISPLNLERALKSLISNYNTLSDVLEGHPRILTEKKTKFPVLEIVNNAEIFSFGFLESITVSIKKRSFQNKFIVVPSSESLEKKIENQIEISWKLALKFASKLIKKIEKNHEVIINFDHMAGIYTGSSLGIALSISFIEQLLLLYNSDYLINIQPNISFTGGIDNNQNIKSVSEEIIVKKIEIVFYSTENIFVIPKEDEASAKIKLNELKEKYPKRILSIIAVENLDDILNRRNIVEIKKQNYVVKTAKRLKSNWQAALMISILMLIVGFYFYRDLDDNPAIFENIDSVLLVKNKVGKELWQTQIGYNGKNIKLSSYFSQFQKLVDINSDGKNEIIIANENTNKIDSKFKYSKIRCYDQNKREIWNYSFKDTISSFMGKLDTIYAVYIIDTLTINNVKILICIANNAKSFSSAIFQLDLQTGKRINSTLWNSGYITNALINHFNKGNNKEIIASFINNGFEQVGVLKIEIDKLNGQCPTTENYKYKNLPIADLEQYIIFPKTDYAHYINRRIEGIVQGKIHFSENKDKIYIGVEVEEKKANLAYLYNYNKDEFEIIIGNDFRVMRDSLVVHGKLKPPLTDTKEYCNLLISQIKYWNGKEFVKRKEID